MRWWRLREALKITDVDCQRREAASDAGKCRQPQPCSFGTRDSARLVEEVAAMPRFDRNPDHHRDSCGKKQDCLCPKHILQLVGRYEYQWELERPVHEIRYHTLSRDFCRRWQMVGKIRMAWPDGSDHLCHTFCAICHLHTEPEQCQDPVDHDRAVREPVSARSSNRN